MHAVTVFRFFIEAALVGSVIFLLMLAARRFLHLRLHSRRCMRLLAAALCVACLSTPLARTAAEQMLSTPAAPAWAATIVAQRAITSEQKAVAYAKSILSSAPYRDAEALTPFESPDELTYQVSYWPQAGIWYVNTWPPMGCGGGLFTISFDKQGTLWQLNDRTQDTIMNHDAEAANPSYRTHEAYRRQIREAMQAWAAYLLPGEELGDPVIHADYWQGGLRWLMLESADGMMNFSLRMEPSMYVARFDRRIQGEDTQTAYVQGHNANAELRRQMLRERAWQAAEACTAPFVPLSELAEKDETLAQTVVELLTGSFGYFYHDAERFECALMQQDGAWFAVYHDPLRPEWNYMHELLFPEDSARTPFASQKGEPEGEYGMRMLWDMAQEKDWFVNWQAEDREAFVREAIDYVCAIPLPEDAKAAIRAGSMTPAQTVQAAFEAYYGPEAGWSDALAGWRDETVMRFETSDHP